MCPDPVTNSRSPTQIDSTLNMASIGPMVSEEMFEDGDNRHTPGNVVRGNQKLGKGTTYGSSRTSKQNTNS